MAKKAPEAAKLSDQRMPPLKFRETFKPLPADHAAALGQVAASWSQLEGFCTAVVGYFLNLDGEARWSVVAELNFLQTIDIVGSLVHCTRDQFLYDHWRDIVSLLEPLRTERNDMIHAEWQSYASANQIYRAKARGKVTVRLEVVSVERLTDLDARIIGMIDQITWFTRELFKRGMGKMLANASMFPPLAPEQSHKARALDRARAEKKARKQADRDKAKADKERKD